MLSSPLSGSRSVGASPSASPQTQAKQLLGQTSRTSSSQAGAAAEQAKLSGKQDKDSKPGTPAKVAMDTDGPQLTPRNLDADKKMGFDSSNEKLAEEGSVLSARFDILATKEDLETFKKDVRSEVKEQVKEEVQKQVGALFRQQTD